jgi:pimeloyl-ACP methyl ester carboxylesterase
VNIAEKSSRLPSLCAGDGEFRLAARHWTGGLRLEAPDGAGGLCVDAGQPRAGEPLRGGEGVITLSAKADVWDQLLSAKPPRFFNDVSNLIGMGEVALDADPVRYAQYYPAVMRALELLRPATAEAAAPMVSSARPGDFDAPVGRYVHLDIEGQDYRVYFEEAGSGIPLLLQHTAGCHGSQWRHLFERPEITRNFRLIAYDLPFHGKSLPPVGPRWWANAYKLTGTFARAVPIALVHALGLERPVFMGCSVGGMLALDLAHRHPELFSAVISLEGGLKIDGDIGQFGALWHPQVSNEFKARLMNALMSPTSPEAYRKETSQVYAAGWPPAFLGDLHYYIVDYDLRELAAGIDTTQVAVHILSGEYDASGTLEHGHAAHAAIAGSTWASMADVGHFPMSENPEVFLRHLLPILEQIRANTAVPPPQRTTV